MLVKEMGRSTPHRNVKAWLATVDDPDLVLSVITVREICKGIEKKRATDPGLAATLATAADRIFSAFQGRILPIDEAVACCSAKATSTWMIRDLPRRPTCTVWCS
jgi:predicted nucleic acid-binding protein